MSNQMRTLPVGFACSPAPIAFAIALVFPSPHVELSNCADSLLTPRLDLRRDDDDDALSDTRRISHAFKNDCKTRRFRNVVR